MPDQDQTRDLPASVAAIARVIGRDLALALAGSCRNGRVYVPRNIHGQHRIASVIGPEQAHRLAQAFGGEILYLAKCNEMKIKFRNAAIRRWHAEGRTRRELADLAGLTERMIDLILVEKSPPMDETEGSRKVPR